MNEKLSALMDGELSPEEMRQVLAEIGNDPGLGRCWGRYHLVREVVHQELEQLAPADLAENVIARLKDEPTVLAPSRRQSQSRLRQFVVGAALAASVAAIALFGVRWLGPEEVAAPQYLATVENADYLRTGATRWQSVPDDVEDNLNAYLVEHSEFSPTSGMNGVMSYVRFVGYDSEQ